MNFQIEFKQVMNSHGLDCQDPIIADGKLHRFKTTGDSHPNSWYVLHDDIVPAGAYGCWKRGINEKWCSKPINQLTPTERKDYENRIEAAKKVLEIEREKAHAEAKKEAQEIWNKSLPIISSNTHPYLLKKQIKPYGIRIKDENLIVPLRNHNMEIQSLQYISPNGNKWFLEGGAITKHYYSIGKLTDKLFICEGYATGATIHGATDCGVVVAFNAGNLLSVAQIIKNKYPSKDIVICADNDAFREEGNIGIEKATEAAKAIEAKTATPSFKDVSTKPTDFNDLMILEGIEEVQKQLDNAMGRPILIEHKGETVVEAIERLAKLTPLQYDQVREKEAKSHNIRFTTLDKEVEKKRCAGVKCDGINNELEDGISPWYEEINGLDITNEISELIKSHAVINDNQINATTLWVLGTYCIDAFGIFPKLLITSPEKRCGKTTVLSVLRGVVHRVLASLRIPMKSINHSDSNRSMIPVQTDQ
ncbi:hypothetical protein GAMM_40021 [Gammaproteobacteria bacterium]